MKKAGVIRFPGTNCDRDVFEWAKAQSYLPEFVWHLDQFSPAQYDILVLPGGFSYGDYLRSGALAAKSPVMRSVKEFSDKGGPVLGICNGFQILCEAGLLPGALVQNQSMRFIDEWAELEVLNPAPFFGQEMRPKQTVKFPIAHGDGRYFAGEDELKKISDNGQIWMKYKSNPNGSLMNIAGVMNTKKNVVGLMPHPERARADWMGGVDGVGFL